MIRRDNSQISLGEEEFMATGLEINDLAYMKVYIYDKWSDKMLPTFNEGETLEEYLLRIADGVTTPPNLLNEGDEWFFQGGGFHREFKRNF